MKKQLNPMLRYGLVIAGICVCVQAHTNESLHPPPKGTMAFTARKEAILHHAVLDTLFVYHPVPEQTDDSPIVTASGLYIDLYSLKKQHFRWLALSRDLLQEYNRLAPFAFGDTVLLVAHDPNIDGEWVVQDTMNKRYANKGDLLFDPSVRLLGRWEGVRIRKKACSKI